MNVQDWSKYKYFESYEFDSPDARGSGKLMKEEFINKLNEAREFAGQEGKKLGLKIIFKINSGVRTASYNKKIGGVSNSSHLTGWAADIKISNNIERRIILNALIKAGLNLRIGISNTFIHVDCDPSKPSSYWTYPIVKGLVSTLSNFFSNNKPEDI